MIHQAGAVRRNHRKQAGGDSRLFLCAFFVAMTGKAVAARALGGIERQIGVLVQGVKRAAVRREHGAADADGHGIAVSQRGTGGCGTARAGATAARRARERF